MGPRYAYMRHHIDHYWFRQWLVACSAPRHYLNQCWFIVILILANIFQRRFYQNTTFCRRLFKCMSSAKCWPSCLGLNASRMPPISTIELATSYHALLMPLSPFAARKFCNAMNGSRTHKPSKVKKHFHAARSPTNPTQVKTAFRYKSEVGLNGIWITQIELIYVHEMFMTSRLTGIRICLHLMTFNLMGLASNGMPLKCQLVRHFS